MNLSKNYQKKFRIQIPEDFYEKRKEGENDSHICSLIRNDSIIEFIKYVTENNYSLDYTITSSIFETNSFLLKIVKLTKRKKFPQKLKNAFRGYKPSKHIENTFETILSILDEEDGKCVDIKEDDIFTIVQQTKVSPQRAIETLYEVNGDLVAALKEVHLYIGNA